MNDEQLNTLIQEIRRIKLTNDEKKRMIANVKSVVMDGKDDNEEDEKRDPTQSKMAKV